jgi:hypothetical protein
MTVLARIFNGMGSDIKYNVLYAVGYVNGKAVARDEVVFEPFTQPAPD